MTYLLFKLIHLLSLYVWVGGMIFVHYFLRKPVATLPADQRFPLVHHVLYRFFNAVSVSVILVLLTGLWMIGRTAKQMSRAGIQFEAPWSWTAMAPLGFVMIAIFAYIRLVPYRRLGPAVRQEHCVQTASALATITQWGAGNRVLGI